MELTCNVHQKEDIHCFEGHITSVLGLQHVYFVNLSHYFRSYGCFNEQQG